jgi:hypothetical protein
VFSSTVSAVAGEEISPIVVSVEDPADSVIASDTGSITLSLTSYPSMPTLPGGEPILEGTYTATASAGVATFSGMAIRAVCNFI